MEVKNLGPGLNIASGTDQLKGLGQPAGIPHPEDGATNGSCFAEEIKGAGKLMLGGAQQPLAVSR